MSPHDNIIIINIDEGYSQSCIHSISLYRCAYMILEDHIRISWVQIPHLYDVLHIYIYTCIYIYKYLHHQSRELIYNIYINIYITDSLCQGIYKPLLLP